MIKVKDRMVTVNGDEEEIMEEFCMLTMGVTAAVGVTAVLAAFVKGLDEIAKKEDDDEKKEETK